MTLYSFINSYDPFHWGKTPALFPRSRIFEYTDDHIVADLQDDKRRIRDEIIKHPVLFSVESENEVAARVGWITNIDWTAGDPLLTYHFDENYRPIQQSELKEIQWELEIEDFEFYRNHWAVKPIDLLKVLTNRGFAIPVFEDPFAEKSIEPLKVEKAAFESKASPSIFVSYSHADAVHLKRLQVHLKPLKRWTTLRTWDDTLLSAGDDFISEIEKFLGECSAAILLISADFIASDFISKNELPPLLEKARIHGTRIIPIIIKPCLYTSHPELKKFQALNSPDQSLISLDEAGQEALWARLAKTVYDMVAD